MTPAPKRRWFGALARMWTVLTRPITIAGSGGRDWVGAVFWFGIAFAGIVFLLVEGSGVSVLLLMFPTTPAGIGGGIGSLYGRGRLGVLLGLMVYPTLSAIAWGAILLYLFVYWLFWPDQVHF